MAALAADFDYRDRSKTLMSSARDSGRQSEYAERFNDVWTLEPLLASAGCADAGYAPDYVHLSAI